jgi:hypothetical protein
VANAVRSAQRGVGHPRGRSPRPWSRRLTCPLSPCTPPQPSIHAGLCLTRHQPGVHTRRPSGLPLARRARMERERRGLSPELGAPRLLAPHVGVGTGHRARTRNNALRHQHSLLIMRCPVVMCDLASHAAKQLSRPSRVQVFCVAIENMILPARLAGGGRPAYSSRGAWPEASRLAFRLAGWSK